MSASEPASAGISHVPGPRVSVLVTVYNREAYLAQTLHSILASSLRDFEVIVVDDCSRDQSAAIAENISAEDQRVRVVRNETNLGDYGNRMKAASLACGTYLKYVDSDDLIYPHTLNVMVDAMERNNSVALALSHSLPEDEEPYPWILTPTESFRKHFLGRGCFSCGPTGAIIRRSAFEEVGGFRKEWRVLSDIDLWLRLGACWPVALLPPGLVWWRRHEGQEFSSSGADLTYLELGYELGQQSLQDVKCPLPDVERKTVTRRLRQHYARRLMALAIRKGQIRLAMKLFKKSDLTAMDLMRGFRKYDS
ncbi:MAG: glycosyltransferase family 2 protein [Fuerstia sp.]|nr:glycosyltransferase family 2 protein [Fuerstiella sp.]